MWDLTIEYNGTEYTLVYNEQSGYYEIELTAENTGGIYPIDITYSDIFEDEYTATYDLQVLAKKPIKFDVDKVFMWVFNYQDFSVRDIVEINDYELIIDEETNAKSTITCMKKTGVKAKDIIAVKKNNEVVYWGIVDEIQNEDGEIKYKFITKNIMNLFDRKVALQNYASGSGLWTIYTTISSNRYYTTDDGTSNVKVVQTNTPTASNMTFLVKLGSYYIIKSALSGKYYTRDSNNNVVLEDTFTGNDNQLWIFGDGKIRSKANDYELTNNNGTLVVTSNGFTIGLTQYNDIMQTVGLEDSLLYMIDHNFVYTGDNLINIDWLYLQTDTHTQKNIQVTNVEDGIYNLHTWLTNCNQMYNVTYNFSLVKLVGSWKLRVIIKTYVNPKELIDTNAQNISNYTEVFETNVLAKVMVKYDKVNEQSNPGTYTLYLKTDRTTTTNMNDPNRAEGEITTLYTENYEDAEQTALDAMKANEYNHNITFNLDKYIKQGTPIAIKTKQSLIFNTYISQVKITQKNFYEYICGNIRINFIEKLKKEKRNA